MCLSANKISVRTTCTDFQKVEIKAKYDRDVTAGVHKTFPCCKHAHHDYPTVPRWDETIRSFHFIIHANKDKVRSFCEHSSSSSSSSSYSYSCAHS
jgi:hypothetical protein